MDALRFLRHFQRSSYAEAQKANPAQKIRDEIEGLMNFYLTYYLERRLNTPEFMKQISQER